MTQEYLILSGVVCGLMILLGLILCCVSGCSSFDFSPLSQKQVAILGILLAALGILSLCFPLLVIFLLLLCVVALLCFAALGVYRALSAPKKSGG